MYRSMQIREAILTLLAQGVSMPIIQAMPALQYKSRGHGKSLPSKNYLKKSGKYKPHHGKKECARRLNQIAKIAA